MIENNKSFWGGNEGVVKSLNVSAWLLNYPNFSKH